MFRMSLKFMFDRCNFIKSMFKSLSMTARVPKKLGCPLGSDGGKPVFFKTRVPVPTRVLRRITRVFPVPQKNLTENAPKAPKFEFSIKHSMKNTKFKLDESKLSVEAIFQGRNAVQSQEKVAHYISL